MESEALAMMVEMAQYYHVAGVPWTAVAFEKALKVLTNIDFERMHVRELRTVPGVGAKIADFVHCCNRGDVPERLQQFREQIPPSVFTMTDVVGIGPARAVRYWRVYGVQDYAEFAAAVQDGRIPDPNGRLEQAVVSSANAAGRMPWKTAHSYVSDIRNRLLQGGKYRLAAVGSYRRRAQSVGDIDFVFSTRHQKRRDLVLSRFLGIGPAISRGNHKASVWYTSELNQTVRVDFLIVPSESWGSALQYLTGDAAHNVEMRRLAQSRGMLLNERGLWNRGKHIAGETEHEIYEALDVPWLPPSERVAGALKL